MKWWDQMPWSSFSECWVLSQLFHSPLSPSGIDLDYCAIEWFALETNRDQSVIFEIASKFCISESVADYDGYSISSTGFLPTIVEIVVIWVKFTPFHVHWFLKCWHSLLPSLVWPLPICLDSWTWHSRFLCNISLYSIGPCFYHQSHPQLGVASALALSFHSFWSYFFIDSSSILGTYWPGEFIFQCPTFLPFHTVHGVLKARLLKWFGIPFPSGSHSVRPLHHDLSILDGSTWHGLVSLS